MNVCLLRTMILDVYNEDERVFVKGDAIRCVYGITITESYLMRQVSMTRI